MTDSTQPFPFNDEQPIYPITDKAFEAAFGESLADVLDVRRWIEGQDLSVLYDRLREEVAEAVKVEADVRRAVRAKIFPQISSSETPESGVYRADLKQIEIVHKNLLFNGAVEACDANLHGFDTLPVTITQIGMSLVKYNGNENTWVHRLIRRDLRARHENIVDDLGDLLRQRQQRGGLALEDDRDRINQLVRRGIMSYAERATLLYHSEAKWRIGHGSPAPFELLTGSGSPDLLRMSLEILNGLLTQHKRFLFVPSSPAERELLTIGEALNPLEYLIFDNIHKSMRRIVSSNRTMGKYQDQALKFVEEVGPQILVGLFRAAKTAPVYLFYAHRDHVHEAALIAIADSVLQEHRGFPMLIDLADTSCRNGLGIDTLTPGVETAFAEAGVFYRYQPERYTRSKGVRL